MARDPDELFLTVYDDLKRLARSRLGADPAAQTWQTTDLVHEVYLKLSKQNRARWKSPSHFFAVSAQAMRRILVDYARGKRRDKRGGGVANLNLDDVVVVSPRRTADILALETALEALEAVDPGQAELVVMRFYGGMTVAEVAEARGVPKRTVESDWTATKAWLRRELSSLDGSRP